MASANHPLPRVQVDDIQPHILKNPHREPQLDFLLFAPVPDQETDQSVTYPLSLWELRRQGKI